ncbi:hypothetical protein KMZ29_12255 [Bradyrhizobium sediminis]|uniref:Uncharacterized protein n=1 Tax=Bradyrhizobium sediminis TaxID=2840469 RepID=A0A975RPC7_9BRAD|nr:hypothetical protein [Bradyrhizobium sediminis]QWG15360.1 hypothetical protein KMZ29_12255 [Bradyrhizobium sediminis]
MASDWSGSINVKVTEANIRCVVTGTDSDALGVATMSGEASLSRISDTEPPRQEFRLSLAIQGRSALQAKAAATVWPKLFDEVAENDDVIGILLKADEDDHRRGDVFLLATQFDKLMPVMSKFTTGAVVVLYIRKSTLSECDLIVMIDLNTTVIAP